MATSTTPHYAVKLTEAECEFLARLVVEYLKDPNLRNMPNSVREKYETLGFTLRFTPMDSANLTTLA
jgi:hypothetical protein